MPTQVGAWGNEALILGGLGLLCVTALLLVYMWFRRSHSRDSAQRITLMNSGSILFCTAPDRCQIRAPHPERAVPDGQRAGARDSRQPAASTRHAFPPSLRCVGIDGGKIGVFQIR